MHRTRMWVIVLCIFLLGGTAGYFVGAAHVFGLAEEGFPPSPGPDPLEGIMGDLGRRLELSAEQKTAIRPIVKDFLRDMARMHGAVASEEDALLAAAARRIDTLLSPRQAAQHRAMIEERQKSRAEFVWRLEE